MIILILGLVVFFGIHSVRMVAGGVRDRQIAANPGRWKGIYSLISLVGLGLIVWGWITFRPDAPEVYTSPEWGRHAAMLLVLIAFVLFVAAELPVGYIKKAVKHPMITGIALWSAGHLLANGDLASVLIFGAFLIYAIVNRLAVIPRGDPAPVVKQPRSDLIAIGVGVVAYAVFVLWLHGLLFGVSPIV